MADNLTTILCSCHECGNLNFQEPSGPLQACNGTALPLVAVVVVVVVFSSITIHVTTALYGLLNIITGYDAANITSVSII
jgi:hypothetical protein